MRELKSKTSGPLVSFAKLAPLGDFGIDHRPLNNAHRKRPYPCPARYAGTGSTAVIFGLVVKEYVPYDALEGRISTALNRTCTTVRADQCKSS
jgi:hypothetical protein